MCGWYFSRLVISYNPARASIFLRNISPQHYKRPIVTGDAPLRFGWRTDCLLTASFPASTYGMVYIGHKLERWR